MNTLISALIDKKAFVPDTIITASYHTKDLFGRTFSKVGDFRIKKISFSNDTSILELSSINSINDTIRIAAENIKAIDGMDLYRYADIYDLLPDGTNKKVGRKRGRKPKHLLNA